MPRIKPWEELPSSTSSSNRAKGLALVFRFLGLAMKQAKNKKAWHFNQVKDGRRWRKGEKVHTSRESNGQKWWQKPRAATVGETKKRLAQLQGKKVEAFYEAMMEG